MDTPADDDLPPSPPPRNWALPGLFVATGLVSWIAAAGASRIAANYLELPRGKQVAQVEVSSNTAEKAGPASASRDPAEEPGPDPEERAEVARASSGRLSKQDYIDAILAGNLFDSTQVGAPATAAAEPVDGEGRPTDLKAVLLGTIVAEPTEFSSALIAQEKGQSGIGYGIDDNLFGEGTVVRIEAKKVFIRRNDGAVEYMSMGDEKEVPEKPGRSAGGEDKAGAEGVEKAGDNKYVIEQSVIDKIIENPEKLYSQARANPHKDAAGNVDGYRLSGIRSKSFFGQLGLKNGDVLHSVNGKTITSMSSAMDAYNSMANEKNFNVEITRRNKRQTMEYEVR